MRKAVIFKNEVLPSSPKIPERLTNQAWLDVNNPKTIWVYGEKRSGKGTFIDFCSKKFMDSGFGLVFHLYSADGFENCYYAYNNNCRAKWDGWRSNVTQKLRDNIGYLKDKIIPNTELIELDDLVFTIYSYKDEQNDTIKAMMNEMMANFNTLKDEGLHCNCYKASKILWMIPEYGHIEQGEIDAFNGVSWKNWNEYNSAYITGMVNEFLPNEKYIDFKKIKKPQALLPKQEAIKILKFALPVNSGDVEAFRRELWKGVELARLERRYLINTQSCYPTSHRGKLDKYTTIAEIFKFLPDISQSDSFAQLKLDYDRSLWTNEQKSWHKIGLIANEIREFAPSVKLSGDSESAISKKAFFNFVPKIRHHKSWFVGDLQSPNDLETGVKIQQDFVIIKRNSEQRLGETLADFWKTIEKTYDSYLLRLSGEDYLPNVPRDIVDKVKLFHPKITEIPDNKAYVLYSNGDYKLIKTPMSPWHHKSDRDNFSTQTGIHYILLDESQMVSIDESGEHIVEKPKKVTKTDEDEEWIIIENLKVKQKKKWGYIIEYMAKRDEDNGVKDSKWLHETVKNLSNKFGYHQKVILKNSLK